MFIEARNEVTKALLNCNSIQSLLELRRQSIVLDEPVRGACRGSTLPLGHDFHEVETLPEYDSTRYTISPSARKERRSCL
jgi:hypothetical protein